MDEVIRAADRDHPADAVLRATLRSIRWRDAREPREVSRSVFAYFRWFGWLNPHRPLHERVQKALDLQSAFQTSPLSFRDADLLARAVPGWLREHMDVPAEFVRALQREPRLWIRARPGRGSELARRIGARAVGPGFLSDALEYTEEADLYRTPEFRNGDFEIQDLSSQIVGLVCDPKPGETWWDACAGQGGKTLHLADLMHNRGLIWASDRVPWRLEVLRKRAARAQIFNYRTTLWPEADRLPTKTKFDGVLVDAPCSGIGTWQRNPHARWTATPRDVRELAQVQREILVKAASSLKKGGRLIYSVCTLTREETQETADALNRSCPALRPLLLTNPLTGEVFPLGQFQLRPQGSPSGTGAGGNGMFIAAWKAVGPSVG